MLVFVQATQATANVDLQSAVVNAQKKLRHGHQEAVASVERQWTAVT